MKHTKATVAVVAIGILLTLGYASHLGTVEYNKPEVVAPKLSHAQEVYIYALEWCESRGVQTAVNPKDRDNTPSYYSWQWKPSTFLEFGLQYKVLPKGTTLAQATELMKQYDLQHAVITAMVLDGRHINWAQQFPDCVTRHIGLPPRTPLPTASVDKKGQGA